MYLARYSQPKLTGVVVREKIKCGKKNCRCTRGQLHGWYFYLYYRRLEDGVWKLKKEYIPRSGVGELKSEIDEVKKRENQLKKQFIRNIDWLAVTNSYLKGESSPEEYLGALNEVIKPN